MLQRNLEIWRFGRSKGVAFGCHAQAIITYVKNSWDFLNETWEETRTYEQLVNGKREKWKLRDRTQK